MKNINSILIASFAAMLVLFSCQKSPVKESPEGIKLNIEVAGKDGSAGTRAAKTGWVAGDKLNLWFDDWNYTVQVENHTPDLVLSYDGSSWKCGTLASGRSLKASGKFLVVYEGYNDLSKYTCQWYLGREWFYPSKIYDPYDPSKSVYSSPLRLFKEGVPYSFIDNTLTASVTDWTFYTAFKVLIKNNDGNMAGTANEYILQIHNTTKNSYADPMGALIIEPGEHCPHFGGGASNYRGKAGGVQETDGIAFYYFAFACEASDNIKFTLQKGSAKRSYTVSGKAVNTGAATTIINVALNYSSFTAE